MKVDIEDIGPDGLDLDESVDQTWLGEVLGAGCLYKPASDGQLSVHLTRVEDVVHVHGSAALKLESSCSRCLEAMGLPLQVQLDVTMVPRVLEPTPAKDGEVAEEDVGISTYEDRTIDLAHVVRDELVLELPMRALCSPECAGLCITCGKNLNEGACGCAEQTDTRWEALKGIKIN